MHNQTITTETGFIIRFESEPLLLAISMHYATETVREDATRYNELQLALNLPTGDYVALAEEAHDTAETILIAQIREAGLDPWQFSWTFAPQGGSMFELTLVKGSWPAPPWPSRQVIQLTPFEAGCLSFIHEAVLLSESTIGALRLAHSNGLSSDTAGDMIVSLANFFLGLRLSRRDKDLIDRAFAALPWNASIPDWDASGVPALMKRWRKSVRSNIFIGCQEMSKVTGASYSYDMADVIHFIDERRHSEIDSNPVTSCEDAITARAIMIEAMQLSWGAGEEDEFIYPWGELPEDGVADPMLMLRKMSMVVGHGWLAAIHARLASKGVFNPSAYQLPHFVRSVRAENPSTWTITANMRPSVAAAFSGSRSTTTQ